MIIFIEGISAEALFCQRTLSYNIGRLIRTRLSNLYATINSNFQQFYPSINLPTCALSGIELLTYHNLGRQSISAPAVKPRMVIKLDIQVGFYCNLNFNIKPRCNRTHFEPPIHCDRYDSHSLCQYLTVQLLVFYEHNV